MVMPHGLGLLLLIRIGIFLCITLSFARVRAWAREHQKKLS
jgi:hypothetical protein